MKKSKKSGKRFSLYFKTEDFEKLKHLSVNYGDNFSETVRRGLDALIVSRDVGLTQETMLVFLEIYRDLRSHIEDGRRLVIEDPKTNERIQVMIPRLP